MYYVIIGNRIICCDYIIDDNTLEIFIPEQISRNFNNDNDILDLIVYSIDDQVYTNNSFKCKSIENIKYTNKDVIINHEFNTNNIDSIIRVTLNNDDNNLNDLTHLKAIFNNVILNRKQVVYDLPDYQTLYHEALLKMYENNEIYFNSTYDLPLNNETLNQIYNYPTNKYIDAIDEIIIYTSEYNQTIYLTFFNDSENVKWTEVEHIDAYRQQIYI
jgi:hypothetical protein